MYENFDVSLFQQIRAAVCLVADNNPLEPQELWGFVT